MDTERKRAICAGEMCEGMSFAQRVWVVTTRIPAGKVATYGQIARVLGGNAARAVGMALNQNPLAPAVPCHRVVGCDGALVGFAGGIAKKEQMLREEGVELRNGKVVLAVSRCEDRILETAAAMHAAAKNS